MTKPTLIVSGGPVMQPLLPQLSERYALVIVYQQAADMCAQMGLPDVAPLSAFMDGVTLDKVKTAATQLAGRVAAAMPEISQRFSTAYNGQAPHLLNGYLADWWPGYAHERLLSTAHITASVERALSTRSVAGVLVHEDVSPEMRAVVNIARARGVPTIHLPHNPCHLLPGVQDIHREVRAEYVLASGDYMARFYSECGIDPAKIAMVGAPQWDGLYDGQLPTQAEARRIMALDRDSADKSNPNTKRVIAYGATWAQTTSLRSEFSIELRAGYEAVLKMCQAWDADLIVMAHPSFSDPDTQGYAKAAEAARVRARVTKAHMHYCLTAADVLVMQGPSNLCIEAAVMGTPSVYIQTEGFDYAHSLPYRCNIDGLFQATENAMNSRGDDGWQDFITYYNCAHPDGGAALKCLGAIAELCHV